MPLAASVSSGTPLWVSLLSPAVAVVAASFAWRTYRQSRRTDRRNLFLKLHEILLEPELVKARKELYAIVSVNDVERIDAYDEASMTRIYRLLAMYDLFALYAKEGWVDEDTVLKEWGRSLAHSLMHAEFVRHHRLERFGGENWPNYAELAKKAASRLEAPQAPSHTS